MKNALALGALIAVFSLAFTGNNEVQTLKPRSTFDQQQKGP